MKVSKTGYKKNSKDKNQPFLLIPSNEITMENVEFPVLGISNTGDVRIMNPGERHVFNGNYVIEKPMKKEGGHILPGRYKNPEGNWLSKYDNGGPKRPGDVTRVATPASHFSIGYTSNPNIIYFHDTATDTWTKFNEQQTANFKKTNPSYFTAATPAPKPAAKPAPKPVAKPAPKPVAKPAAKPVAKAAPAPAPVSKPSVKAPGYWDLAYKPEETVQESTRYFADPFIGKQMEAQQMVKEAEQTKVPVAKVAEQKKKKVEEKKTTEVPVSSDEENDLDIAQAIDETFNTASNFITENIYLPLEEATISGLDATLGVAEETARSIGDAYDSMTGNESKDSFFSTLAPQIQYYREKHFGTYAPAESELQIFEDPNAIAAPGPEQKQNIYSFDPKKVDLLSIDTDIDYGKGNSQFWGFRRTANNDDGFTYVPTPRKQNFGNGKGTANVQGMAHFLIESDLTDGYKSQATTDAIERSIKNNQYVPAYKKDYNTGQVHIYYVKGEEPLKEGYNYAANLRQLKLSDIDWNKSRRPAGYGKGVSNILTKDGKDTFIVFKDADVDKNGIHRKMGRNNGNSLVFIIEKDGKRYIRDFAGTVTQIKNESKKITEEFGVPQDQVTLGFYDQGSYNAKPKAKDGFLPYSSYNSFHNSGVTGAGLAVPMYAYGGQVSSGLPTKAYGGDISIPDLSRPNWLDKYQGDEGSSQVERRDPNQPFFPSATEAGTYESQYSLPEVSVTPNWTEAELERNRLRDKYIKDDKKVWRHWYDKLGYDKDNVTKRANQFAYNKLAKQYLRGGKDNLTPEQRRFVERSEYAGRLQPNIGQRFAQGLKQTFDSRIPNSGINFETLGNVFAPFEYPTNLVRGAVKGDFKEALRGETPSPYFVSSDLAGTSPTEAAIASGLVDVGVDTGIGAFDPTSLSKGVKAATKPIKGVYNTVATGESFLPVAWKSPAVGLTQSASDDMFRSLVNSGKLTPEERALVLEYQHGSRNFTGRGLHKVNQEKRQALNNIINKYKTEIGDDVVLTRMFNDKPDALGATLENGRLNFGDRPTSFTAGVQPPGYGTSRNRLVIPKRYSKQMGDKFLVNQYDKPSEDVLRYLDDETKDWASWLGTNANVEQERELIGTGLDFRQIGKVKNDIGGYDLIVKPNNPTTKFADLNQPVKYRKGLVEDYNPETQMYEMYEVNLPSRITPGRPYEDVQHKMRSLRKDLGIGYIEHLANKYIPGFAKQYPLDKGSGLVIDPQSGRLFDSNTRYWLNREYGITPKIDPLLQDRARYIGRNYGTKISESAEPVHKTPGIKWQREPSNTEDFMSSKLPGSPNSKGPGPMMLGLPNYTHEVKNVDYFKKMLDSYGSNKLSSQSKKYFEGIINSVRKQEGLATKKQYDMLQRLRTGDFNYGKKEYGGWLHRYQDGSQVPQSWKDKYDWTPNVEEEYQMFKNDPNAPENLRFTDDMKDYNTRGMWDSLDRPSNWQQALDLFKQQQGYEWTPEDDGYYHAWSQHPGTGEWLKPKHHSTGWMNYMGYAFDPNTTAVVNPEGFFGNETLQAYPRKKNGGIKSSGEGYYDYINGYSGIFAKGGVSSKKSSWLNKYK